MTNIKKLSLAGLFLAVALLLPFLTGQIPQIGSMLSPMHIPVLICGIVCGARYGAVVGFVAPLLRFMLFGMPPIFPTGIAMAVELAVYGLSIGLIYQCLPKKTSSIYVSLIAAMLIGRAFWGATMFLLAALFNVNFSLQIFLAGAFINAVPGIILHILLVPVVVIAINKFVKTADA